MVVLRNSYDKQTQTLKDSRSLLAQLESELESSRRRIVELSRSLEDSLQTSASLRVRVRLTTNSFESLKQELQTLSNEFNDYRIAVRRQRIRDAIGWALTGLAVGGILGVVLE